MRKLLHKISFFTLLGSSLLTPITLNKVSANPQTSVPISYIALNIGVDNNLMLAQ